MIFLFLSFAFAQKLSWTMPEAPEGTPEDQKEAYLPKGFYIQYQIYERLEDCKTDAEAPYFVDVKNVLEYDVTKDVNFQPGLSYLFRVSSYNESGRSQPSSSVACVKVRGEAQTPDLEIDDYGYNNNSQQREGDHEETFYFDDVSDPTSKRFGVAGNVRVEPRRAPEHNSVSTVLLGKGGERKPAIYRGRKTSGEKPNSSKLHFDNVAGIVDGGDRVLLSDGRKSRDTSSRESEPKIEYSVPSREAAETDSTPGLPRNRLGISLALLTLLGIGILKLKTG